MAKVLEQLEAPGFRASKSDKKLFVYVKENLEEIPCKPISQMAKESGIGEATITRFAKKMGFSGLQDFKVALAQETMVARKRHIINSSIENDESARETARKLLSANIVTLENTLDLIRSEEVHRCAQLLIEAKKIYFIGMGYSGIIAQDSNYKFMRIGMNCVSFDSSHTMFMVASIMEKGDLVFAVSHSGETDEIIRTVEVAKRNGARIISMTEDKKSPLKELSDVHLAYVSGETVMETGSISSKMAQFFLLDLIYTQVVKELAADAVEKKIKTTNAIRLLKGKNGGWGQQ